MSKKLLVFVSSTYNDLLEERQAAVEAVLKAGHIPAGMELFAAGNKSQLETIYDWIDQCDVYFLILGGRYGSVDPETGKSYTELEYDYARSKGKPYFSVVINQSEYERRVKARGIEVVEGKNPQALASFRQKVLESISSFFDDTKDIKLTVFESLSAFAADTALPGWVSGRELEELTGLRKENADLREKIARTPQRSSGAAGKAQVQNDVDFTVLEKVLLNISLVVPKDIWSPPKEANEVMSLQDVLIMSADNLVKGISSATSGAYGEFLYGRVLPKLQIHALADSEKPAGEIYRRGFLNKTGQAYLAWLARRKFEVAE